MVHDDETRRSQLPPEAPESRPTYWAEKENRLAASSAQQKGRTPGSFALPMAVVIMTALIAFLIVWMVMHNGSHNASPSPASSVPTVAGQESSSTTSQPTSTSSTSSASPTTSTAPTTSSSASAASSESPTESSSSSTSSAESADFPAASISTCGEDRESIGDDDVRLAAGKTTSCDFVHGVAQDVKSRVEGDPSVSTFTVTQYSAFRQGLIDRGKKVDGNSPDVTLNCTRSQALTHCVNDGDAKVDMWVRG